VERSQQEAREPIDARVDSPEREGLTGTAPANLYAPTRDRDQLTIAPDGRPLAEQPAWRQDFPIDWPQDNYVERRDFMKFLVLTSLAFTVGQFWIAAQNWWRARRGRPPLMRIAALADMPVGGSLVFAYPGRDDRCVLVRATRDDVFAYSQKCTHLSCAVIPRPERGVFECPCHDGVFDLKSGVALAGPPRRPLPRIALDVRRGDIYATDVEWRMV
jgi:nitrite reductase/ring-hydroxylating ferredoxin subunit